MKNNQKQLSEIRSILNEINNFNKLEDIQNVLDENNNTISKEEKAITEKFIKDLNQICIDIDEGVNLANHLETLNDTLIGIEAERILHEENWRKLDQITNFEAAVLRVKVKLLERTIANI